MIILSALQSEVSEISKSHSVVLTGVGKINATQMTTSTILNHNPSLIINYGTAAKVSRKVEVGKLYEVSNFLQRDMNVTALGFKPYETPFQKKSELLTSPLSPSSFTRSDLTCGTGDNFYEHIYRIDEYDMADMEAYAIAKVCLHYGVPFRCFKYISDDGNANDWEKNVAKGQELMLSYL